VSAAIAIGLSTNIQAITGGSVGPQNAPQGGNVIVSNPSASSTLPDRRRAAGLARELDDVVEPREVDDIDIGAEPAGSDARLAPDARQ
jgi:hypothetical protein